MKNKLGKLAIVTAGALLLSHCNDQIALRDYQKRTLQNKLEQMPKAEADAYIRNQMDGIQKKRVVNRVMMLPLGKDLVPVVTQEQVDEGLYLDFWDQNDTNGTLIDEYVDYAMKHKAMEQETKDSAKADYRGLQK